MLRSKTFRLGLLAAIVIVSGVLLSIVLAQDDYMNEPVVQDATVHRFADLSEVADGFAHLVRYDNGVTMAISTNDLVEGDVYTVWWVIFNEPENCSDGVCDVDDVLVVEDGVVPRDEDGNRPMNMEGIAAANVSIQHAAGGFAQDGTLHTSATLGLGEVPGIVIGPGLLDPYRAEIHLVLRTHGPAADDIDVFADQISTFGGGCEPMDALPCDDHQFAIFEPTE
jgi:hypothetical protein